MTPIGSTHIESKIETRVRTQLLPSLVIEKEVLAGVERERENVYLDQLNKQKNTIK